MGNREMEYKWMNDSTGRLIDIDLTIEKGRILKRQQTLRIRTRLEGVGRDQTRATVILSHIGHDPIEIPESGVIDYEMDPIIPKGYTVVDVNWRPILELVGLSEAVENSVQACDFKPDTWTNVGKGLMPVASFKFYFNGKRWATTVNSNGSRETSSVWLTESEIYKH